MSRKIKIFLDIETIPAQQEKLIQYVSDNLQAPGNYKKQEAIDAWMAENKEAAYRKTALNGGFGQVVCIGYAFNDETVNIAYSDNWNDDEAKILQRFFDDIKAAYTPSADMTPVFIGHNIENFDLRFIFQRAIILGIKPPSFLPLNNKSYNNLNVFDTMTEWAGKRNFVSLNELCIALNVPPKDDDIDGSKVWDYVKSGQINRVAEYCGDDVDKVRVVYNKMNFIEVV